MAAERVKFCGAIAGSVTVRKGESVDDAIARAQATLIAVLDKHCKSLGQGDEYGDGTKCGPNVGLEADA